MLSSSELTGELLQAVLAEAQVVCIGQPLLIAGDLNADPAVIPYLKGISAGKFVDLALAYSLGAGFRPDATCKFKREDCVGSRGTLLSVVLTRWLLPLLARLQVGGSLLMFLYLLALVLRGGRPILLALRFVSRSGLLAGLTLPIGPSSSVARVVQDVDWDELAAVPLDVVLALRDSVSRSCVDDCWTIWS